MGRYDDIIGMSRPKSDRPSMPIEDRAKIFMPFSALKGYDEEIDKQQKNMITQVERRVVSEKYFD